MSAPARVHSRSAERFFASRFRALVLGALFLTCVGVMALMVPAGPSSIDQAWSELMTDLESPALKQIALIFDALGRGIGSALTLGAIGVAIVLPRRWVALVAFAVVETLTPLLSSLLKATIGRPRPPDALIHPLGSSFPSGHSAYAAATGVALVVLFTAPRRRRDVWWVLAWLGTVGMAWSRTYLQVHWLSDVLAGSLLGAGVALVVFGIAQAASEVHSSTLDLGRRASARSA
jgi:membrane-associated phospholipid phosphatase